MFQQRQEIHYAQKYQQPENHKELHGIAIRLALVLTLVLCKNKRLVGITKRLRKHHHHNRNLDVGSINTHHRMCCLLVIKEIWDYQLTHVLAHYPGYSKHKQRPRITQHTSQQ